MPAKFSYCYVWADHQRKLAHVFVGDESEPDRKWRCRHERNSQLNDWLKSLPEQPPLDETSITASSMYGNWARAVCKGVAEKFRARGYKLLSARCRSTYKSGPQKQRPVYCGNAGWFASIRKASRATGMSPLTIRLRCEQRRDGYRFDTP